MSVDAKVAKDLADTLEDGRAGFAKGAEHLDSSDAPELATTFRSLSEQRAELARELENLASQYGDDVDASGTMAAKVHRGWMGLKDALTGTDPKGVLDAAEQGEDHAVEVYKKALAEDLSGDFKSVVERQFAEVKKGHDTVRSLREQHQ